MTRYIWMRWLGISLLVFTLACWLFTWKLDSWLQHGVESYIEQKTHFKLHIGRLQTDIKRGSIDIYSLRLTNPQDFPDPRFLEVREIKLRLDWSSLLTNRPVIYEMVLDIEEFCGVRNATGANNVSTFASAFQEKSGSTSSKRPKNSKEQDDFFIHRFLFRLDHVTVADYKDGKDDVKTARLNLSKVFNNVSSYQQLITPLVADLSVFVTGYILDSIVQATLDPQQYHKLLPKLLTPIKSTLEKGKQDAKQLLNKLLPENPQEPAPSSSNAP